MVVGERSRRALLLNELKGDDDVEACNEEVGKGEIGLEFIPNEADEEVVRVKAVAPLIMAAAAAAAAAKRKSFSD